MGGQQSIGQKSFTVATEDRIFWPTTGRQRPLSALGRKYEVATKQPLIFAAVDANDCPRLRQLIHNGHNINKRDVNGLTALHLAAINGNEECVDLLLEFGPLLMTCPLRQTALHFAAQTGTKHMIDSLMNYGSVVNTKDSMGATPLTSAVEVNNMETTAALLSRGAQIDTNVCLSALQNGFTDVLRLLVNYKPNIVTQIDFKDFRFTRLTSTGLKILYYSGLQLTIELMSRIKPLDWSDFCLGGQIRLPPHHYNRDKDIAAFDDFIHWLDTRQEPPSLKCLSRLAFRQKCGDHSVELVLSELKIPVVLQCYLLLKDITD